MSDLDTNDRDFIDVIWQKTRYLEHQRYQEEKEIEKLGRIKIKKIKNLLTFCLGLILISVPIIITKEFDETVVALLSLYMLGFALYYEYNFS